MREADILLHVVDISHHSFEDQVRTVNETLKELGAGDKETITVFNKIDAYKPREEDEEHTLTLADFKNSWMGKHNSPAVFISAQNKENLDELRNLLHERVKAMHQLRYPNIPALDESQSSNDTDDY